MHYHISLPIAFRTLRANLATIVPSAALVAVSLYGLYEHGVANRLSKEAAQLKDRQAQIGAAAANASRTVGSRQSPQALSSATPARRQAAGRPGETKVPKPDPRWRRVQDQLDAQGRAIESTQAELASTRSDLQSSIAKTHEEVVVLQKRGERNYFEFDLEKSKHFHSAGPVGISLRKANTKHQYADLKLLVDDRELTKKHLNLYEPAIVYPSEERQPVELVVISITKNHIKGYISAPKYKPAELAALETNAGSTVSNAPEQAVKPRQRLAMPH